MNSKKNKTAIEQLEKLIALDPKQIKYYDQLAAFYAQSKDPKMAADVYQRLSIQKPKLAVAHYNKAFYLRQAGQHESAIKSYKKALQLNIDHKDDVHLNIALIYSEYLNKVSEAEEQLKRALQINAKNLSAHYNLATLYEDCGDKKNTKKHFSKILEIQPGHPQALSRMAYIERITDKHDELIGQLIIQARSKQLAYSEKLNVLYALGKALDDCGQYEEAFKYYRFANELNRSSLPVYDKKAYEEYIQAVISQFSSICIKNSALTSTQDEVPVFICGMFRSGSTLTEQVLAAHPEVTAGGERDFFVKLTLNKLNPFPDSVSNINKTQLSDIASDYLNEMKVLFPDAKVLTDKRPDNLLYIGLIKMLYPKAKIIHSLRNPLDNCLSVYFLRLGQGMPYSSDLENIAHYYQQQMKLMQHWKNLFPDSIYTQEYEKLIATPGESSEKLLKFIGLDMHPDCLDFHKLKNTVKTASVWQVRQPLYTSSSGRWHNYAALPEVINLVEYFKQGTTK